LNRKFYFRFELIFFSKITAFLHEMPIIMSKKQKTPLLETFFILEWLLNSFRKK